MRIAKLKRRRSKRTQELAATAVPVYDSKFAVECGSDLGQNYYNEHLLVDPKLPCHGCAHSTSGAPFPGHPSGERPCCFCVRNPNRPDPSILHPVDGFREDTPFGRKASKASPSDGIWYDGTPAYKTPMDNYISLDRLTQNRIFDELNRVEKEESKVPERMAVPLNSSDDREYFCCGGGPAPGGHAWTCILFLGISYG